MKLEIQNLTAGYDQDVILKDFSLAVEEGEFLSLLGPSGCGKSTLLKTIAGIVPAKKAVSVWTDRILPIFRFINGAPQFCSRICACFPTRAWQKMWRFP